MKKLLMVIAVATSITAAKAQTYVLGGVNLANITTSTSGQTEDNKMLTSFNAGILSRFGLSKMVDLESGLMLTGKGSKANTYFNNNQDYVKTTFNPLYLELPLNLVVKVPIAGKNNVFVHAGPYAAMGIGGKSTSDSKFGPLTSSSKTDIKFSNDNPFTSQQDDAAYNKLKRFDFGANVGAGIDLGKIILRANYGFGLTKINSTQSNNGVDDKNKQRVISFSVGIPLGI